MKVEVTGDMVTLELNGQQIYERQLEPTNRRRFGLFNYAEQTVTRVRNVVMRGDWPKTVPSISDQELRIDRWQHSMRSVRWPGSP